MQMMTICDQPAPVVKESIGCLVSGTAQRKSSGDGVNAIGYRLSVHIQNFGFLRHSGPHSLVFWTIETEGNSTGNRDAISYRNRPYFSVLDGDTAQAVPLVPAKPAC